MGGVVDKKELIREALRVVKKGGAFAFQDLFLVKKYYGEVDDLVATIRSWGIKEVVVLGIAIGSGLVFRGRYVPAVVMMAIFFGIPLLTWAQIPWNAFAPMVLIGVGVIVLVKAFLLKDPSTTPTTT